MYVKESLARLVVELAHKTWPQNWQTFLEDMDLVTRHGVSRGSLGVPMWQVVLTFCNVCRTLILLNTVNQCVCYLLYYTQYAHNRTRLVNECIIYDRERERVRSE